ncbi:MAG: NAD(P)H-binding protein [Pseudomonadota bacterium]
MRVSVFGATGMVGKVLTQALLDAGHDVTALVRSKDKLEDLAVRVQVLDGEYFDPLMQREALQNVDAVLTTIGPPMKRAENSGEYERAMTSLVSAMQEQAVTRIVSIAGAGVKLVDEKMTFGRATMRRVLILLAGQNYLDKEREHNVLAGSSLDWTIVRPPQITDVDGAFVTSSEKPPGMKVDRKQLAEFMVKAIEDRSAIGTAPFVATV